MPVMSSSLNVEAGEEAVQHPVEAVLDGRARAARRAEHRTAVELADQQQVAGIDRHAEMAHRAAGLLDRGGDHVGAVGDRGGAEGDQKIRALAFQLRERFGERAGVVRHARLVEQRRAGGLQPLLEHAPRLVHHRWLQPGQRGRGKPDLQPFPRRDRQDRRRGARARLRRRPRPASAKGMIFTVATMRPASTGANSGKRRDGQAGIEAVQRVDRRAVDDEEPGAFRVEIAAAGARLVEADILAAKRLGDAPRRLVLMHVAGLEPRRHHLADALDREGAPRAHGVEPRALLDDAGAMADRVRGDRAFGLGKRDGPNFIGATRFIGSGGDPLRPARPRRKRRDHLCEDRDGDLGRRLRADVDADRRVDRARALAGEAPCPTSRSTRLPCVFRLPSAPT